ncbi:MAG: hypothetical protein ACLTKE_08020 [Coprococcus sp.]
MIYVVVEELIPQAHMGENGKMGTLGFVVGFLVMMILDVAAWIRKVLFTSECGKMEKGWGTKVMFTHLFGFMASGPEI